jgi:PAS domain S-box-containing protein
MLLIILTINILILITAYYLLNREISKRQQTEIVLRQQTERERLVTQIAHHIRESLNLEEVLVTTVAEVRQFLGCDRVLIYRLWSDGTGTAITETVLPEWPLILGQSFPEEVFPQQYHQAYSKGKTRAITDIEKSDIEPCLIEFVKQFGVKAKLVVPILQGENLWGLLIAHHCSNPRQWETSEIELMKQLATQVAIAIQQSELYEQLQELNADLEIRVQQRTEELALANEALRHTNHTLQALIFASPRAIFTLDLNGNVKIWNPAAERIFGWTEAEVCDRPNPIVPEDKIEEFQSLKQSILQGTIHYTGELRRQKKDGTPIDISFSAAPLKDSEGNVNGLVAVVADITEQKRQEEELRLLQSVVVNTNDAILITEASPIDEPGPRILYANKAFTNMTGYTLEEVLGKTPRILQGAKTDRTELNKVRDALSRWESTTVEVINYRKDSSEFWVEFSVVPVADKTGWYTHWIAVQRDITERKEAEAALRRSEERFRSLIENALDIITIIDTDGTISYESPSVEKVLGYACADLVEKNIFEYIHPDDVTNALQTFTNTIQNPGTGLSIEFRRRHKDGTWRIFEAISQKFVDYAETTRIFVNSRDITERKRLDEIRLALEKEKELSALKVRFFSMASHEFRTPLSTILAAAQLLENSSNQSSQNTKIARNLNRIESSVKTMIQLLDDILTINRAETGKLEFTPQNLNLETFCLNVIEEIRLSQGANHQIKFSCVGECNRAYLDEKLLKSILSNLLSNAIKYSPQGSDIYFSLQCDGSNAILRIRDRGIGISEADQKHLFEPFHRGKNVRNIPGTGLGLVVVKKCVELHSGSITLKSEVGVGTTFTVSLPLGK